VKRVLTPETDTLAVNISFILCNESSTLGFSGNGNLWIFGVR
jgi:hypothetical protein